MPEIACDFVETTESVSVYDSQLLSLSPFMTVSLLCLSYSMMALLGVYHDLMGEELMSILQLFF